MSGGYELTLEQIYWMIPRIIFLAFIVLGILLIITSHFKSKFDINEMEINTIREKAISCLEDQRDLTTCLKHNTRAIKIEYDDKKFLINKKSEGEVILFNELVLIDDEIKEVRIEIA